MIHAKHHPQFIVVSFFVEDKFTAIVFRNDGVELSYGASKVVGATDTLQLYALINGDQANAMIKLGDFELSITHDLFTELSMQPELEDYYLEETL